MDFTQTIVAQGPDVPISITDEKVREGINRHLDNELDDTILSPESGIQKIRKVLSRFGVDMPALYGTDPEGDEIVIDLEEVDGKYYLYLIYVLTDDSRYEFYAEIVDEEGLEEIESDEEEDEEEE
jgi:hypothetical protein